MSDFQEKSISLKMQHSEAPPKSGSTKGKEMGKPDFTRAKNAAVLFETLKYAKLNYPLGKFVGVFYWEKVGQDLLLEKALWQEFLPIWRLVRNEAFSLAGSRSEERVVCSKCGCRCRDFKKYPMFDAFYFVVLVIRKM